MSALSDRLAEWKEQIPATIEQAEELCLRARSFLAGYLAAGDLFAAELLLREAATNAVIHGCGCNRRLTVRCELHVTQDNLFLLVAHDGAGFDWRAAFANPEDPEGISGRGLAILNRYAAGLQFDRTGRQLILTRKLTAGGRPMETRIAREGAHALLVLGGDLVAASVPALRERLRELVRDGAAELDLDLANTVMVDSSGIGLLIATHESLQGRGGILRILHASPEIQELFQTMRLGGRITVVVP
jgi:anti-anti-sigma factor